ncbi:GNAT family N-acetyltransferase [Blastomonas sp.]|uniref:GNAT family N-acetyltransferase n=1 Tax=Blastomonas sp. TaxID=1909299 RepID=UPI00391DCFC7
MTTIPVIETERLRLRAPVIGDFEAYARMWADERVTAYIGGSPRTRNESWTRFIGMHGLWALTGYGYWLFADRQSDALVGVGGLANFERGIAALEGFPEAGWAIAPDYWGRGLVSEAMDAVMAWADQALGAPEIRCIIDPGHGASEHVAGKLGFAKIGEAWMEPKAVNVYARR